ncbi:MAG: hypothetical protein P8188_15755 [Gemmatimonadota bacterium]
MLLERRAVQLRLRNRRALNGQIHITEGQSLATFLSTKLHFLNLTQVEWGEEGAETRVPHLSVRMNQIVWAVPMEPALHLSSAELPSDDRRSLELLVEGGYRLHVQLNVARETRMSDHLDANPGFLPLWSVRIVGTGQTLERMALNHDAIEVIRELDRTDPRERA